VSAGSAVRLAARVLLGAFLVFAGIAHQVAVEEFLGQVPTFLPWREAVVVVSGVVEIVLGVALLVARGRARVVVGWLVGVLFVAVLPGNVWQLAAGTSSFGLDTTAARWARLPFQPLLIAWALWCTGAWAWWRASRRARPVKVS